MFLWRSVLFDPDPSHRSPLHHSLPRRISPLSMLAGTAPTTRTSAAHLLAFASLLVPAVLAGPANFPTSNSRAVVLNSVQDFCREFSLLSVWKMWTRRTSFEVTAR